MPEIETKINGKQNNGLQNRKRLIDNLCDMCRMRLK